MQNSASYERICHGIRFYQTRHKSIRRLKREHAPLDFGFRVWTSCWLLMEYVKSLRLPEGQSVMEIGCGWGLTGIFCAKELHARVTCLDGDSDVFPFLRLHSDLNQVSVRTLERTYEEMEPGDLSGVDMMLGSDICYWDELVDPIARVIGLALESGVRRILIADPGRSSFEDLARLCQKSYGAETITYSVDRPHIIHGRIMKIERFRQ